MSQATIGSPQATPARNSSAVVRTRIKHLLRKYFYEPPVAGAGRFDRNRVANLIFDRAPELHRFRPETFAAELLT